MLTTFAILVGLLAPNTAMIAIDAQPKPSRVEVDGRKVQMRLGKITVKAGKRKITVHRSGYMSQSRVVDARIGKTAKVKFRLTKKGTRSPAAKRPGTKRPAAKRPAAKKPLRKPAEKRPGAKRPGAKKPTSGFVRRPGAKKPVAKRPLNKRPAKKPPVGRKKPRTVGRKPTVAAGRRPAIKRKPTVGKRPKTKPRPRTTRPRGGAGGGGAAPAQPRRNRTNYKGWAVFSFVVGGAAATGGVLAGMQADDKADEFNRSVERDDKQTFKDEAEGWSLGSNVLYGVAATGVLVGALLWAMDDNYQASVAPLPGGGAYVGLGGTF